MCYICTLDSIHVTYIFVANPKQDKVEKATQIVPVKSDPTSLSQKQVLCKLELGSMVQYGTPPQFGVIKWMGKPHNCSEVYAGLEMASFIY